jgi:hypothetical protein
MTDKYIMTDKQWHEINDALLAAISICAVHVPDMRDKMIHASCCMDEIIDANDEEDDDE